MKMVVLLVYPHLKALPQLLHTGCNKSCMGTSCRISLILVDQYHSCMKNNEEAVHKNIILQYHVP